MNPETGKGWTDAEERAFAQIMAASRLTRIQAIHLWKRCGKDAHKALHLAKSNYPKPTQAILDRLAKARTSRLKAVSIDGNRPPARDRASVALTQDVARAGVHQSGPTLAWANR